MRGPASVVAACLLAAGLVIGLLGCDATVGPEQDKVDGAADPSVAPTAYPELEPRPRRRPLAGRVIVLDPGHQLGNAQHPDQINEPVDAGGFTKPCNTTGTSTDAGYAEATFVWEVSVLLAGQLRRRGARVVMTRTTNSSADWGPCVDERGRAGNPDQRGRKADLKISLHADGSYAAGAHGFHVIAPEDREGWTDDIARPSLRFARHVRDALVRAGFDTATYTAADGIDVRGDLGTLNLSDVPTVMVELGNMRDAGDAAAMATPEGRAQYAAALARAILENLGPS